MSTRVIQGLVFQGFRIKCSGSTRMYTKVIQGHRGLGGLGFRRMSIRVIQGPQL